MSTLLRRPLLALLLVAPCFAGLPALAQEVTPSDPVYIHPERVNEVLVQTGRRCAAPDLTAAQQARVSEYVQRYSPRSFERMAEVVIPVAYHVVTRDDGTGDVPNSQLEDQIDVLNAGFAGTGFQFTLASIDRTANNAWFNHIAGSSNETAMKTALAISPETTLNFYTGKPRARQLFFVIEILGYATFPFSYPEDDPLHGVVVDYESLPGGALTAFDEGDTGTHEVGHYVGLYHTFQGGCAAPGDEVEDTPYEAEPFYGNNCDSNRDSCPQPGTDPITNFMDYSDDICLDEFTPGQAARAQDLMATYRPTIFSGSGGGNEPPVADFGFDCVTLTCDFTDLSVDPDGSVVDWAWDFGDGATSTQQNPTHAFPAAGTYNVTLTVTDNDGTSDTDGRPVTVTTGGTGGDDTTPPALSGAISGSKFEGTATDNGPDDTGIATIALRDATNLNLSVDPFATGASSVSFTVTLQNRRQQGKGFVVATDVAGNESELWVCSDSCPPPSGGGEDTTAPSVTGAIRGAKFDGTASDSGSGIASVELGADAVNLALAVDPFTPGASSVGFEVTLVDRRQPGSGTVIATDVAGNEGTLFVDSQNSAQRPGSLAALSTANAFALEDNYPNPFNAQTRFRFSLGEDSPVTLTVFDMMGREVARLADGFRAAGSYDVLWDGTDAKGRAVASGVYVYRLDAGSFSETKRMVLMK